MVGDVSVMRASATTAKDAVAFVRVSLATIVRGSALYYAWVGALSALIVAGIVAYAFQARHGLSVTNMNDIVSWGAYIANFTYLVGLAAAAVMVVIPAYIYKNKALKEIVFIGELLAVSAVTMCLLFVTVDLGRPDRFWHMAPVVGLFNFPISMLSWDVVVLNGYLFLNAYLIHYGLFSKYRGKPISPKLYLPVVFVSMAWAVSIHTVTAFLYSGFGGRPFWNSAVIAPRFLASAFVAGPAFLIIALQIIRDKTGFPVKDAAITMLRKIVAVTILLNLFLAGCEAFKEFYTDSTHVASAEYLYFGLHGHNILVPYIWTSVLFNVVAAVIFVVPRFAKHTLTLNVACLLAFVGVWIEKGMGLLIPGFVPSPLGEIYDYQPSMVEFFVSLGVWSVGLLIFTVTVKIAVQVEGGQMRLERRPWEKA